MQVRSPGETVLVGCYVDRTLKRALVERARANERTVSGELRLAITRHLRDLREHGHDRVENAAFSPMSGHDSEPTGFSTAASTDRTP